MEVARHDTKFQPLLMTYIGPKKATTGAAADFKKPLLLVLTDEEFAVTCLSYPDLTVKWKAKLPGMSRYSLEFSDLLAVSEHAMVADYTALYKGDVGAVFVTLRFGYGTDVADLQGEGDGNGRETLKEEVVATGESPNTKLDTSLKGDLEKEEQLTLEYLTEPSFFAFDLTTGAIRWRNTARDMHSRLSLHDVDADAYGDADQEEMSQTAHDYRRHLAERSSHFEEGNWRIWKDDLVDLALPHQWYTTRHTSLLPQRFAVNKDELATRRGRREVPGLAVDFEDPYHYLTHTYQRPSGPSSNNVLLYEHSDGITVIHLYTGRILTRLSLAPYRTHADANGDSTINSVFIDEEKGTLHMSTQYEEFGTVTHSQEYTVKLPLPNDLSKIHQESTPSKLEFSHPLLLPASTRFSAAGTTSKIRSSTASFNGIIGKTLSQILPDIDHQVIPDKAYFMIFLNSEGMMYCVRSDTGEIQWVVETPTGWSDLQALRSAIHGGFSKAGRIAEETLGHVGQEVRTGMNGGDAGNTAQRAATPIQPRGKALSKKEEQERLDKRLGAHLIPFAIDAKETHPTGILAITPVGLVLVAPDGSILARQVAHMPSVSKTTLPIVADVNNDGRNDIIIVTHRAYQFFYLSSGKSHVYPLLVTCFLLALIAVAVNKAFDHRRIQHELSNAIESLDGPTSASAEAANRGASAPVDFMTLKAE